MSIRRRRSVILWLILALAAAFAAGGMAGARFIRSPEEAALDRRPPSRTTLTAPVEFRVLTEKVVTRGTAVLGRSVEVTAEPAGDTRSVVTALRARAGSSLRACTAAIEISGRPLFLVPGRIPAYRDLDPGVTGPDVRQLQQAMASCGLSTSPDRAGDLGPGTVRAVELLYARAGYQPMTAGDRTAVTSARAAVRDASETVRSAERSLRRLLRVAEASAAEIADARAAVGQARSALRDAHGALSALLLPHLPRSELFYVPSMPATVAAVSVTLGSPVEGVLLRLDLGLPRVTARLDPDQRALLRVGMRATVVAESTDESFSATIVGVGAASDDGSGAMTHPVSLRVPDLPRALVGTDVRIMVDSASTDDPVLVVPLSAVTSTADGRTSVQVASAGTQRTVWVRPGLAVDGEVAVQAEPGQQLSEGDQVVVGADDG